MVAEQLIHSEIDLPIKGVPKDPNTNVVLWSLVADSIILSVNWDLSPELINEIIQSMQFADPNTLSYQSRVIYWK